VSEARGMGGGVADRNEPVVREPVMRSAVHRIHAAMGGVFERRSAWEVPALYGSEPDEVNALGSALGFADVSARGKVHLSGAIEPWITKLTGSDLEPQRIATMPSGAVVARIARDWALVLTPPSGESSLIELDDGQAGGAMATDVTSAMSAFLVAGPQLHEFLSRSVTLDVNDLQAGRCAAATWSRIPAVLVMRELAAPAVELYVSADHGRFAWETIRQLAGRVGGSPVGWHALETWGWR
jgi:glycine cleavage system aminomethyltransferase T